MFPAGSSCRSGDAGTQKSSAKLQSCDCEKTSRSGRVSRACACVRNQKSSDTRLRTPASVKLHGRTLREHPVWHKRVKDGSARRRVPQSADALRPEDRIGRKALSTVVRSNVRLTLGLVLPRESGCTAKNGTAIHSHRLAEGIRDCKLRIRNRKHVRREIVD